MNLQVKDYIIKSKTDQPCLNVIKNNTEFSYDLIFDKDIEISPVYFFELKSLIKNKPYSVQMSNPEQIDFLIDLVGGNKYIQKLTIDSQILNILIQTKLYKDIFKYVQELFICGSLQSVINNVELEEFVLNYLTLEQYDPQFLKEYSTINKLIEYSKGFKVQNMNFKKLQQIDKNQLLKFDSSILLRVNTKGEYNIKTITQGFQLLNDLKNIKKVKLEYPYEDKTYSIQQQLVQLDKDIELNVQLDKASSLKQLSSLLKQKAKVKNLSLGVPQHLINPNVKGLVFFDSFSSLTSLSLQVCQIDIFDAFLQQMQQIKNSLKDFTLQIDYFTSVKQYCIEITESQLYISTRQIWKNLHRSSPNNQRHSKFKSIVTLIEEKQ